MNASEFQQHATKMFPLVSHLGLQVKRLDDSQCVLSGQYNPNKNHIGTVFGGSLYCFTALASYGWIFAKLDQAGIKTHNIVISQGSIKYLAAVTSDFEAICESPSASDADQFVSTLKKKSKSRLQLKTQVICQGQVCAEFTGDYVAKI